MSFVLNISIKPSTCRNRGLAVSKDKLNIERGGRVLKPCDLNARARQFRAGS